MRTWFCNSPCLLQQHNHNQEIGSWHTKNRLPLWRHPRHHRRCWSTWPSFGRWARWRWTWQLGRSRGGHNQTAVSFCDTWLFQITWFLNRQACNYHAFKALDRLIPNLLKTVDNGDPDALSMFYAQVMLLYLLQFRFDNLSLASGRCN